MRRLSRSRRVKFLFLMVTCILGNYFSPQNFTVYSRVFLIPHLGVLISIFGLIIIFLLSSKSVCMRGEVLALSVVQEWSHEAN